MKRCCAGILALVLSFALASCAYPPDRYNTQRGALIGAGAGALLGQAIGGSARGTLAGLAAGTVVGALVGNAVDQDYQAARDAAGYDKPVVYYDRRGRAVEAVPEEVNGDNCRTIRKKYWEHGELVKETEEEVCDPPVVTYREVPPPPVYYVPPYPSFSFYFGRPYYYRYHHPYRHHW